MRIRLTLLLMYSALLASSCQAQTPQQPNATTQPDFQSPPVAVAQSNSNSGSLDERLLRDLARTDHAEVANEWSDLYDRLDAPYKNTVHTGDSEYKLDYGDLYGLNKGFYWGLCGDYENNELGDAIYEGVGATGGKSRSDEERRYRAGMVYFYVKYKLLKCE